ncbi:hypothetical protein JTB14_005552 [Gonioctena quinquepunctata]|nr:hypothetical protein JTB14_005552 [Gonioctena quinquepunctata]
MGIYDLPAVLELVIEKTKQKPIYLGVSLGTTVCLVLSSTRPEIANEKLKGMILYAPVGYMNNLKSYVRFLVPYADMLEVILKAIFIGAIPKTDIPKRICSSSASLMYLCETIKMPILGNRYEHLDALYEPLLISRVDYVPLGIVAHYAQIIRNRRFEQRDFGKSENINKYGQPHPPLYDVSKISVPAALFTGPNDWLGTEENAKRLYGHLDKRSRCGYYSIDNYSHMDFEDGREIVPFVLKPTLNVLDTFENGECVA